MNIPASITFLQAQSTPLLAQKMGHNNNKKNLGFIRKSSWFPWTTKVGFIVLALFARVTLEDKVELEEANSSAGLLCISECATCPVICSPPPPPPLATSYSNHPPTSPSPLLTQNPPPPPLLTSYPPPLPLTPSHNIPPPPPLLTSYPPPLPLTTSHPPPPLLKSYPPPPSLPPPVLPLPSPQPIITPPSHSSSGAAPPPPPPLKSNNNNPPSSSGSAQPNVIAGPHNYPYPYYYYYASDASHFPIHVMPFFLPLLLFLHHIFF